MSILSQLATWSRDPPLAEAISRVFSSRIWSVQLIWTAVGIGIDDAFPISSGKSRDGRLFR